MYPTTILAALFALTALGSTFATADGTAPDAAKPASLPLASPSVAMQQSIPAYPQPQTTLPPGEGPWVPLQALQPAPQPPVVDYGPVADTPVVELPGPILEQVNEITRETPPASVAAEKTGLIAVASLPDAAPEPDYGPIAPTPVVDLLALTAQSAASEPAPPSVKSPAIKKPAVKRKAVREAPVAVTPPKKRMCWNNGVVAPCR